MWSTYVFFFNDTATTEIYTLSLHDALPISPRQARPGAFDHLGTRPARAPEDYARHPRLELRSALRVGEKDVTALVGLYGRLHPRGGRNGRGKRGAGGRVGPVDRPGRAVTGRGAAA